MEHKIEAQIQIVVHYRFTDVSGIEPAFGVMRTPARPEIQKGLRHSVLLHERLNQTGIILRPCGVDFKDAAFRVSKSAAGSDPNHFPIHFPADIIDPTIF